MRYVCLLALLSCDAPPDADNSVMRAAEDSNTRANPRLDSQLVLGATVKTIENANLRDGPSATSLVLRIVPSGASLIVTSTTTPRDGFYYVRHDGLIGWVNGAHLLFVSAPATPVVTLPDEPSTPDNAPAPIDPLPSPSGGTQNTTPTDPDPSPVLPTVSDPVDAAIARAESGLGYSYWWGGSRWDPSGATETNKGICTGSCGDCTHSGQWGADCSGYVAKIWQVPDDNTDLSVADHTYSTINFVFESHGWTTVDRYDAKRGDAYTYNVSGSGHIFLYESGDSWGDLWAYEAKGCAIGIVHDLRSASDTYKVIRRDGY